MLDSYTQISTPFKSSGVKKSVSYTNRSEFSRPAPTTPYKTPSKTRYGDRFIPQRNSFDLELGHFSLVHDKALTSKAMLDTSPSKEQYKSTIADSLFDSNPHSKILSFQNKPKSLNTSTDDYENKRKLLYAQNKFVSNTQKPSRQIPNAPEKILDAPEIMDDYYLNLLDWSSSNLLAVALKQSVYLWNASDQSIFELVTLKEEDNYVSSLSWSQDGTLLAIGTNHNDVQIWDVERSKQLRRMRGHMARVGALAWNQHLVSSGSRDSNIFNHDVRVSQHHISSFQRHTQEVCGLKWSHDGTQLASGGNDNLVNVWDMHSTDPVYTMDHHIAAVKAISWCPWQKNLLATGGGTADRTIRFWNTSTGACLNAIDTRSQVCQLLWSKNHRELVSSHGYSQNQLIIWKYPQMHKVAELTGHQSRVLHMTMSPDGNTVVSAAADETLRFWNIFENESKKKKEQELLEINRSHESQALALGLAPSTAPKTTSTPSSSSAQAIEQLKKKYDQKINQLVALLEAKAEDCIQLQDELKALEKAQKVMKNENEQLKTEIEKLKKDVQNSNKTKQTNEEIIEELQRRIITLSSSLEEMAMENLELDNKLRSATGKPSTNLAAKASPPSPLSLSRSAGDEKRLEALQNQIKSLEAELQSKKQRIETLESDINKEIQENIAVNESCDKYEDKIREVEKKMKDNLSKEASRRREAEYSVTRLKKKVQELQFLLEEKDDDYLSSDSDSDSDSEDKKNKKKNEQKNDNSAKSNTASEPEKKAADKKVETVKEEPKKEDKKDDNKNTKDDKTKKDDKKDDNKTTRKEDNKSTVKKDDKKDDNKTARKDDNKSSNKDDKSTKKDDKSSSTKKDDKKDDKSSSKDDKNDKNKKDDKKDSKSDPPKKSDPATPAPTPAPTPTPTKRGAFQLIKMS